ncbi:DUF4174 domain-containing protein [Alkalilimnicola ehrlichii]|nr:DUF4174 domain-containing protein [Alkalilimnicola ehrlichii]
MSKRPAEVEQYQGLNRLLLIFAPANTHPAYVEAREWLRRARNELDEWDIRLVTVFSSGAVQLEGERAERADAAAFRRDFGAHREEFTAILLDVDGSERLRQHRAFDPQQMLDALRLSQTPQAATRQGRPAPHARR